MGIFSKLFVAVMAHIIMENADKKNQVTSYLFSIKNRGYTFVIFFIGQSLHQVFAQVQTLNQRFVSSI